MADLEMRRLKDAGRDNRKAHLSPFGIVMWIIVYVAFICVMVAIVPKDAKWWWDTSYPSSHR